MNYRKDKFAIPYLVIFCILLLSLTVYLEFATDLHGFLLGEDEAAAVDFTREWTTDDGKNVDLGKVFASDFGGKVHLTATLPKTLPDNAALCMITRNADLSVEIAHSPTYRFTSKENLTGFGHGTAFHMIVLCPESAGEKVSLDFAAPFKEGYIGNISKVYLCSPATFRHLYIRKNLIGSLFSILVIFFGLLMLGIRFLMPKQNVNNYNLASLGGALCILGLWCLVDTGVPQFLTGCIYACRILDYTLIHLAIYPLVRFVNSVTKRKRPVYSHIAFWITFVSLSLMMTLRYVLLIDMVALILIVYATYASALILIVVILADDRAVNKKEGIRRDLTFFYIGIGTFLLTAVMDVFYFQFFNSGRMQTGHGHFLRVGLIMLLLSFVLQVLKWWTRDQNAIRRDRLINRVLKYAMGAQNADIKINAVLEYLCDQMHADRAFVFEDQLDGTFANTYEFCQVGVHPEIANLQDVPYDNVIEVWYDTYKTSSHIIIDDLEKYRSVSEEVYRILKPQGTHSLVTGPLEIEGKYVGFYGVANPPAAYLNETSEILRLLSYVFAQLVSERDEQNILLRNSYHDEMTGVKNRRALDEFEENERDVTKPFGYIMCDINGLKHTNDTLGHDEGDSLIIDIATALASVFGYQNVYRLGGDEFIIYDFADNELVFNEEVAQVRKYIDKKNRSVSIGCVYCKNGAKDIKDVRHRAEEMMYQEKKAYYEGNFDRRDRRKN